MDIKVAILHDLFLGIGGGERFALEIAKHFDADIYSYICDYNRSYEELKKVNINIPKSHTNIKILRQLSMEKYFENLKLNNYDAFIATGFYGLYGRKNNKNMVWYSYGPSPVFYDKSDLDVFSFFQKLQFSLLKKALSKRNFECVKNMEKLATISKFSAGLINKIYKRKPEVIYPPVETKKFYYKSSEDFYLVVGRLEKIKRIDVIINAFKKMKDKTLVIVGDGSLKSYLENLAAGYSNIKITGKVSEPELLDYYSRCIATISIPDNDHFCMIPIEGMAAGKPAIAANSGGVAESVEHKKNGYVINPNENEVIEAIKYINPEKAIEMKNECIKQAKLFDASISYQKLDKLVFSLARQV